MHPAIDEVRSALQAFQDAYTRRDASLLPEFLTTFAEDIEVIGTNGIQPGVEEWYQGRKAAGEMIAGDWEGWGDVALDVAAASIQIHGETAWLAAYGTVTRTIPAEENIAGYLDYVKQMIDSAEGSARDKLITILRDGTSTLYEFNRGETFIWPLRLTAVLTRAESGWIFRQLHFSLPTIYFPDVRKV